MSEDSRIQEKIPLSVIIVTLNEAHNIEACLQSVSFAREIIIFDSGSTDNTVEIARRYTQHVYVTDWPGDGPQKNRALNKTTQPWILCLDADERVTAPLQDEIRTILTTSKTPCDGYIIPYQSTYLGKPIRFGDWRGEAHLRLFQKAKGTITNDIVHCHIDINGKVGKCKNKIIHHPFHTLEAMLYKLNVYSTKSAETKFKQGKKATFLSALSHGIWSFFRGYILRVGFLDGIAGFNLAFSNAVGTYYRYLKLMQLCKENVHV